MRAVSNCQTIPELVLLDHLKPYPYIVLPKVEPQYFRANNTDFAVQMLLRTNLLNRSIILLFVQICMNEKITKNIKGKVLGT